MSTHLTKTAALFAVLMLAVAQHGFAADHLDAPMVAADGASDINDLFAFQSTAPNSSGNSVLILTVNPLAGQLSGTTFGTDVTYEFKIDNDGDALTDITYAATFGPESLGTQVLTLTKDGNPIAMGNTGSALSAGAGSTVMAGVFDDPFFFDLIGFQETLATGTNSFTGDNFFNGANVSAIVLEVPSSELISTNGPGIGVWARTVVGGNQIDRMGRPAINTVLIPGDDPNTPGVNEDQKDAFNQADPVNDVTEFDDEVRATITALGGDADFLAPILLPDLLTYDTSDPGPFLNGRGLADDVIDAELNLLTGGGITTDLAVNDSDFLTVFPYLAPANLAVPEPSSAIILLGAIGGLIGRRTRR